jgi:hypothetical protein
MARVNHHTSVKEKFEIGKKLDEVCVPDAAREGLYSYLPGWDDAAVARAVIPNFNGNGAAAVGYLRQELKGNLFKQNRKSPAARAALDATVGDIVAYLDQQDPDWRAKGQRLV